MLLYRTSSGIVLNLEEKYCLIDQNWDELINTPNLYDFLKQQAKSVPDDQSLVAATQKPLAPIGNQEVWAAGVTYFRSRTARMEESQDVASGGFYDKVYEAKRPEIFFKATAHRVVGPGQLMHLRSDSEWVVPEPELTLVISRDKKIIGYTIGNDLSCRDIEGENPLYLPQAKTFDQCAALGPAILVANQPLDGNTKISMSIYRNSQIEMTGTATLSQMKRTPEELVRFLFQDNSHPNGCFLMTGTGIVPADNFCLQKDDLVEIAIERIGTLSNSMA